MRDAWLDRYRLLAGLSFYLAAGLEGAFSRLDFKAGEILTPGTLATAATMWCVVDALIRNEYLHRSYQFLMFFLWPVAVPVYWFHSRSRLRAIALTLANAVALFVLPFAGAEVV